MDMKYALIIGLPLLFIFMLVTAKAEDDVSSLLESHLWQDRVVVLLTHDVNTPDYIKQVQALSASKDGLIERDILLYHVVQHSYVKQDARVLPHIPASRFMDYFDASRHAFTVMVIGKDGTEKLRKHTFITTDALFALVDAMPMQQP